MKNDRWLEFLILMGLVFLGAAAVNELLTPTGPCWNCGTELNVGTKLCSTCGAELEWTPPKAASG